MAGEKLSGPESSGARGLLDEMMPLLLQCASSDQVRPACLSQTRLRTVLPLVDPLLIDPPLIGPPRMDVPLADPPQDRGESSVSAGVAG